jgi:hypothetical protein
MCSSEYVKMILGFCETHITASLISISGYLLAAKSNHRRGINADISSSKGK